MNRTLDDLRTTLQVYGDQLPASSARTLDVHKRIRRIRRHRVAAGVAAVALIATSAVGVRAADERHTEAAASASPPPYAHGGRLVATMDINGRHTTTASTALTATTSSLILNAASCSTSTPSDVGVDYLINGVDVGSGTCGTVVTAPVRAGARLDVEFRLARQVGNPTWTPQPLTRTDARVTVVGGVYTPVPRAAYRFPSAPATLTPLDTRGSTVSGNGNMSSTSTVDLSDGLLVDVSTVAPGVVSLLIDGKPLAEFQSWDYATNSFQVAKTPAGLAALGVTALSGKLTVTTTDFQEQRDPLWAVSP